MSDDGFEARILRFEQDWRRRGPAEIADHLPPPGHPDRLRLLLELACVDLEFRWRDLGARLPATLESYADRFPELGPLAGLPADLIAEEYRVRHRWGDRPTHAAFLARFPGRPDDLGAELARVDEELAREADRPPPGIPPMPGEVAFPAIPRRSHRELLLKRMIGQGRMGKVYEAEQPGRGGQVAVKFLRKALLRHPRVVRRFLGEAETVAGLHHPNIVGLHGLGRTPGGSYFLVMDLMDGPDLAEVAQRGPVAAADAVRWAIEACDALGHAHDRGVIHCDLKPANLLLDGRGMVRVADFGLARPPGGGLSWAAEVEGTAPFMAPEQAGRRWGPIDARTDVYGIGAVLFALLTARPPILGRRLADILAEVVAPTPIASPAAIRPGLPEGVVAACRKCLAKNPDDRFRTMAEVRAALAGG